MEKSYLKELNEVKLLASIKLKLSLAMVGLPGTHNGVTDF
jgi:hypothetical protein